MAALISVIIPVYNTVSYLEESVQSVLKQTWADFELILVDDGSDDGSGELCDQLAKRDRRIRVLHQEHKGVSAARNAALSALRTDPAAESYLFFLDSDDSIHPELLQTLCSLVEKTGTAIISSSFFYRNDKAPVPTENTENGKGYTYLDNRTALHVFCLKPEVRQIFWSIGGKLLRREAIKDLLFDEAMDVSEDTLFLYRLLLQGADVIICDQKWYYYRQHPFSAIHSQSSKLYYDRYQCRRYISCSEFTAGRKVTAVGMKQSAINFLIERYRLSRTEHDGERASFWKSLCLAEAASPEFSLLSPRSKLKVRLVFCCYPLYLLCYHLSHMRRVWKKRTAKTAQIHRFQKGSGIDMTEKEHCTGCGACEAVCPVNAIKMRPDREGFLYPEIDRALCSGCGQCNAVCPVALTEHQKDGHSYYGARVKAEDLRAMGSSGGIFPLLASHILAQGGSVFGAALLPDNTVQHICVRRPEELSKITQTKYVQSDLSRVWDQLRPLSKGGPVLFCGTPCQTDAVRRYLGKDRAKVILVDLICYGVPSPGIWARYVKYLERKHRGKLQAFCFRDKRAEHGRGCSFRVKDREYFYPLSQDLFCLSYFKNINIRPACFHCRYTTAERTSDLTLGDFWGVERIRSDFDDGKGCSAVLCHTPAGEQLWKQVREQTHWFSCQETDIVNESQPRLRTPTKSSSRRTLYMKLYRHIPFPLWLKWLGK